MFEIPSSTPFGSPQLASKPLNQTWQMGPWLKTGYLAVGPGVGFKLIYAVLCLPSQFGNCTFCRAEYSKILPFFAIWQKFACLTNYQERWSFPWPLVSNNWFSKACDQHTLYSFYRKVEGTIKLKYQNTPKGQASLTVCIVIRTHPWFLQTPLKT